MVSIAPLCDRIWVMQKHFFRYLSPGLLLGILAVGMVGCEPKPSSSVSSVSPSPNNPTSSSQTAPESSTQEGSPDLQSAASSPNASPDTPLNPEDQALTQDVQKELQKKGVKLAIQPSGKTSLGNVLISQQTEQIVKGRFASDMKQLAEDMPTETEEYYLQILQADAAKAIVTATAKMPGLPSYTGAVFAVKAKLPIAKICKTKLPSEIPPSPPTLTGEVIKCGADSVDAEQ
jgi:hypothetical protein